MAIPRILIIGGGFAGVACARRLRASLPPSAAEVVLFNRENHLVFSPLLADAVGSSINIQDITVPLRQLLPEVECRTEEVLRLDPDAAFVEYTGHDGLPRRLGYDHVVLACGNVSNLNVVPGMADHAFSLKTIGDAAVLRTHVLERMEKAEVCDEPERCRWYLSFIVVGGGFSGVEVAGEINDLVRGSVRFYRNILNEHITVTLIHSRDQLLPEIGPSLREFAREKMQQAGVTMRLNARVTLATADGVGLKDGFVRGGTIVCTIGSTTAPVVARLAVRREKDRLLTTADMSLPEHPNVWAIGDCAHIVNAHDEQPSPATGQFAERQGRQCADNILRRLRGEHTRAFRFKVLGQLCSIGGHSAVAELFGMRLSGFCAWFVWRGVYLFKLPSWGRRIQVGADWAWLLWFPRDLSHIRTDTTERVTHAHFEPGDYIIREGEPPANFYVVEKGEVEVVRTSPAHPSGEVIATFGAGSFFGEQALLGNRPRTASVRARVPSEIIVMGSEVFSSISKSLAPLRAALADALARRSPTFWQERPAVFEALRGIELAEITEKAPGPFLAATETLLTVTTRFANGTADMLLVSNDGARLDGLVTLADMLRKQGEGLPPETPVANFMVAEPAMLSVADDCTIAASAFRESGHKALPVVADKESRRIVGIVRARRLIARILERVGSQP